MKYFDRFDICEAFYIFACEYHKGQNSKEYQIFGRLHKISFKPSPFLSKKTLTENGRNILASLIKRYRKTGM